jgi:ferric-dicitrate binding protein FerR (iron transport regulator)
MNNRKLNELFDDVTAGIRNEKLNDATVKAAGDRVWTRLGNEQAAAQAGLVTVEHLRGCDDFQALIPAYLGGYLTSARTMLLEDHTRECVPCRKALKEARHGHAAQKAELEVRKAKASWLQLPAMRWALAAALAAGFGLFAWPFVSQFMRSVGTLTAIVEASSGNVYRVAEHKTQALKPGERLTKGERLRTAKDAGAVVKLSDGSTIETRERSELSVNQTADGITINLERGNIIVQAAKQGGKHLYVATPDSLVSVTGTIFSVNSGTKGSRISVVEGEVQVNRAGEKRVLHPGEQLATHASIAPVPVKDEVAWSRDAQRYRQLLDTVKRDIDAKVAMPGNRYSTRLLDLMPEDTIVYAAIPNLSQTLAQANSILQENIQTNPELREWYEREQSNRKGAKGRGFDEVLSKVTEFGQFIGQEIAIGAEHDGVLALADLTNPTGFRAYLEGQLASLSGEGKHKLNVVIVDDPLTSTLPLKQRSKGGDEPDHLLVWINNDLLAASTDLASLQSVAASLKGNAASRFNATPFHARLAEVYREGAGLLIGADLERLISRSLAEDKHRENETAVLNQLGVTRLKHFIAEMKDLNGQPQNRAVLTYEPAQHGLASWLAAPGPMGALQFISPDANVVASFVVQNPTALYDDLMNMLKTADSKAWQEFNELQTQHGVSLREDFAAKLGGEFAVAVDGPVIPTPSWKVVVEVNNPEGLQQNIEHVVAELNKEMAQKGGPSQLVWENSQSGARTFYRLKPTTGMGEVNYTYAYGYLIAAPSKALVENALKYHDSSYTLPQSAKFKAALPADKQANFSAMVYNVAPILAPLAKQAGAVGGVSAEGQGVLKKLANNKAGLGYAYAFGDRMILSLNTEDGPVGLTPSSLLGMPGGFGLRQIFKEVVP